MSPRFAGIGAIGLGAGIAVAAVLGPALLNVIKFRTSNHIENQFVGGEIVSLGVVSPVLIAAGVLWLCDHRLAPGLAIGPALYAVYTYTTVIVGQEYGRYDGNSEKFFPLYVGLVAPGVAISTFAWSRLDEIALPAPPDGLRRAIALGFIGLASFIALAWAAQFRLVVTGHPPLEYIEGPAIFWTIKLLDFGFCIPALMATGIGLLRYRPVAVRAAYALAPFATLLAASIAGMVIAMELKHDPSADATMLAVAVAATGVLSSLTFRLLHVSLAPHSAVERLPHGQTSIAAPSR